MKNTVARLATVTALMVLTCIMAGCGSAQTPAVAPMFERGIWMIAEYEGYYMGENSGSLLDWKFTYNERGQVEESRLTGRYSIVWGGHSDYTWSEDGLSFQNMYLDYGGSHHVKSEEIEKTGTYRVEYDDLSARFELTDGSLRCTLDYREDGTLERKVVYGGDSEGSEETFEYNEHGDLVHYVRAGREERVYDIRYDGDVPVSATVDTTFTRENDGKTETTAFTYDLALKVDEEGNIVSAKREGWFPSTFSWVYVEHPDPLARLLAEQQLGSALELL